MMFPGIQVITNKHMTVAEHRVVDRNWTERLFSRPWQPTRATKVVTHQVPDPHIYRMGDKIICHPEVAAKIAKAIEEQK